MAAGDVITVNEDGSGRKGVLYDGTGDFNQANAHAVARVAANDASGCYTAWVYVDNLTGSYSILGGGDNNGAAEHFYIAILAGKVQLHFRPAAAVSFTVVETAISLTARTWHHVCVNHTGVRPDIYIDGAVVAMTDTVSTDLTDWYDELPDVDEFTIGATTKNNVESNLFLGAIGQVKYYAIPLTAAEILREARGQDQIADVNNAARITDLATALVFNITCNDDGTTDSGSGADNGTLTGNAYYGGLVSDWSYVMNRNVTGHAGEVINTVLDGNKFRTIIVRGD